MDSISNLLQKMTMEEKAALVTGATLWTTVAVERLGIPGTFVTDGPHGVRKAMQNAGFSSENLPATCFSTASSLASSWDPDLLAEMGQALGDECVALGVDVLLGPGANMKRSPLCGRNFEYFSEDPYLAGEMAAGLIEGIQSKGVGTSLKHFAANNQETERFSINAEVDERALREIYLPAFEKAVKKGKPWTVMCAYNRLNGTYASEHHWLLSEVLKGEWGFEGLVMSDWGAVHDRVASLKAGLDLEMPGAQPSSTQAVIAAVKSGTLGEAVLNEAVRRILFYVQKAVQTPKDGAFDVDAHHALARRISAEGMVLLKNKGVLPLKAGKAIAVIGLAAKEPTYQGGGSSHMNPTRLDVPLDEMRKLAGINRDGQANLTYAAGYTADGSAQPELTAEAVKTAKASDVAVVFIAAPGESEGYDRTNLDLSAAQIALVKAVCAAQPDTVVVLNNGSAVAMADWIDGAAAVLEAWTMGQAGGGAIADILFGRVNPSGKLAETFPLRLADTPAYLNFPGENGAVRYGEGLFIGYRYYDARQLAVQFPFGHGLSYTQFTYSNPKVSAITFKDVDGVTVSVDVTNTGAVPGKEVVQVYVSDVASRLKRPFKELKGFAKVALKPGETCTVSIPLDFRAFAYYHPGYHDWIAEEGEFEILTGASSTDIHFTQKVNLESTVTLPSILRRDSTLRDWMEDPRGMEALQPLMAQMMSQFGGIEGGGVELMGMDMLAMISDMPLCNLGLFLPPEMRASLPFDQIVDGLVAQVHGKG